VPLPIAAALNRDGPCRLEIANGENDAQRSPDLMNKFAAGNPQDRLLLLTGDYDV
jgi:hypothetical protein